jgi:perosamine synthetase
MDKINAVAKQHNLPVIADGAHALGSTYKGKPIGTTADFTMFSLQAIKHITTGDGGMLSMIPRQNDWEFEDLQHRCWYGIDRKGRKPTVLGHPIYDVISVGGKYHMNNIAATIGLLQLGEVDKVYSRRKEIVTRYDSELKNVPGVTLFEKKEDRESSNWLYTMHVEDRFKFAKMLASKQVESSVVHWRNDIYTVFGVDTPAGKIKKLRDDLPNTDQLHKDMISIPLHTHLSDDDISYVIQSIKEGW